METQRFGIKFTIYLLLGSLGFKGQLGVRCTPNSVPMVLIGFFLGFLGIITHKHPRVIGIYRAYNPGFPMTGYVGPGVHPTAYPLDPWNFHLDPWGR